VQNITVWSSFIIDLSQLCDIRHEPVVMLPIVLRTLDTPDTSLLPCR